MSPRARQRREHCRKREDRLAPPTLPRPPMQSLRRDHFASSETVSVPPGGQRPSDDFVLSAACSNRQQFDYTPSLCRVKKSCDLYRPDHFCVALPTDTASSNGSI